MKDICVVGLGHVGLPIAAMLASRGSTVLGVDVEASVISSINSGISHIPEPGITQLVADVVNSGHLSASRFTCKADTYIIAVPTPLLPDKSPDLHHLIQACESITPHLGPGSLVIVESTIPPGTTTHIIAPILNKNGLNVGENLMLAHCPERVLPGNVILELGTNDRIIGGVSAQSSAKAAELYRTFVTGNLLITDSTTAEFTKLAENTYRDLNIALANELAQIAEATGVDVTEVIELANRHPRVNILSPGPGVGGHCIPIDPWFLVSKAQNIATLIPAARQVNDSQPEFVANRVLKALDDITAPRVAILGVAYKGNVSDVRETPATAVIDILEKANVEIRVHDPYVRTFVKPLVTIQEAFTGVDIAVLLTDHSAYLDLDPNLVAAKMRSRRIFDTRNVIDKKRWIAAGFDLFRIGHNRPDIDHGIVV